MPSLAPAAVTKAKTATLVLILSIAVASVLVCITYKRLVYSFRNSLILPLNLVVLTLFLVHRVTSKDTVTRHAPLFSFPSLSQPLVSFASISLSQPLVSCRSLSKPLFSLPSLSLHRKFDVPVGPVPPKGFLQPAEPVVVHALRPKSEPVVVHALRPKSEPVVASLPFQPKYDVGILDDNIMFSYQEPTKIADVDPSELEGNKSLDDTWNAIVASGSAKPVKTKKSETRERSHKRGEKKEGKKSETVRRRKEKGAEKVEEIRSVAESRQKDQVVMLQNDLLFLRVEKFIKKQYDTLKIQREESDQRRLLVSGETACR